MLCLQSRPLVNELNKTEFEADTFTTLCDTEADWLTL